MDSSTVNILQITDTHIAADVSERLGGIDTRESFLAVRDHVRASAVTYDSIWLTGDLTANSEVAAYEWLFDALSEFEVPILCVPGNHDESHTLRSLVSEHHWQCCGEQAIAGWHIVLLDSAVPGAAYGNLDAQELVRLDASLRSVPQLPSIVVLHHNPIPMRSRWLDTMTLRNAEQFWSIVDQHTQVRCVVWGHVHQNFDSYRNGIRLLATPSTCVQFDARSRDFAIASLAPGYRRLSLSTNGEITSTALRISSTTLAV